MGDVWMEDFPGALARAGRAIDLGAAAGAETALAGGLLVTGMVHAITAQHERADEELQRALGITRSARDLTWHGQTLNFLGNLRNWHGRYEEALTLSSEGIQVGREHPQLVAVLDSKPVDTGGGANGSGRL